VQRVVVLGPGGAGKSELAAELGRRTGLPVVHLDPLFWAAEWKPAPRDDAVRKLETAVAGDRWILDGNFLEHDGRFARADTVVFLDLPRATCIWRVFKRLVRDRQRRRPDLPEGAREGFDPSLLRWIWRYPRTDRPRVLELLARLVRSIAVHHLRSRADVRRFLATL
jgi:adenylate kinase family enzyme